MNNRYSLHQIATARIKQRFERHLGEEPFGFDHQCAVWGQLLLDRSDEREYKRRLLRRSALNSGARIGTLGIKIRIRSCNSCSDLGIHFALTPLSS